MNNLSNKTSIFGDSLLEKHKYFDLSKEIIYSNETGYGYDFNTYP